ncbi:MAG: hypothetical protein R3F61_14880 [Myxococcota bacterium]
MQRILFVVVGLSACSGGVSRAALVSELTQEERESLCEEHALQESVLEACGAPIPVRVGPLAPEVCARVWLPEGCSATVGAFQDCQAALAADPCGIQQGAAACAPLEACGVHVWSAALGLEGSLPLTSMGVPEIEAVCAVSSDYEPFSVECEEVTYDFDPMPELCESFGFGGCGTLGQILDCQRDLVSWGDALCDGSPPSCEFTDCG